MNEQKYKMPKFQTDVIEVWEKFNGGYTAMPSIGGEIGGGKTEADALANLIIPRMKKI